MNMLQTRYGLFSILAVACAFAAPCAEAGAAYDFHGLLFQCGRHPAVNIAGAHVWGYEADLTRYTEGVAKLGANSVTLTFPRRFQAFTITMRAARFYADGAICQTDPL
jgi:hypothetical protein